MERRKSEVARLRARVAELERAAGRVVRESREHRPSPQDLGSMVRPFHRGHLRPGWEGAMVELEATLRKPLGSG